MLLIIGLSVPTIMDAFSSSDVEDTGVEVEGEGMEFGFINKDGSLSNIEALKENFVLGELNEYKNEEDMEDSISSGEIAAGYIIESPWKYQYIVENNEMMDSNRYMFEDALTKVSRIKGFEDRGIAYSEVEDLVNVQLESETKILGKDSAANYLYTYILVFALYFIIIVYGQLVATSVASEKSNRAMEVLVTSTDSKNLIFGKVLGGALAGFVQMTLIIGVGMLTYNLNATAWDNKLDYIFNIPGNVLLTFSIFGILGYIFFSFIFGALGALVSRTEDVSSSATPITIIFVAVFMIAVLGMQNTEGLLLKIASFVPLSSFMAMFVRVSMGTVSTIEIVISLVILVLSTILIGVFASMIYRMGTLMYGNPIKLKNAIKILRGK
jgi:ABC-2 type transport system permease protein